MAIQGVDSPLGFTVGREAVWRAVRRLGKLAGLSLPARPHGLRHAATTRLLDLTGGDVRRVRRFTRHAKLDTVAIAASSPSCSGPMTRRSRRRIDD